jgi:hypothetical protein
MRLKKLVFFDYKKCTSNPISPNINIDINRNEIFFQIEVYMNKNDILFETPNSIFSQYKLPPTIFNQLPDYLIYNMELFGLGEIKNSDITEYVLFFKPWIAEFNLENGYLPFVENYIYIVPYRILKSLLAHGISFGNFNLDDLKSVRVIRNFNENFFNDLEENWEDMAECNIPYMGSGICRKIYEENKEITINPEYNIAENRKYLFS